MAYFHQEAPVVNMENYLVEGLEPLAPLFASEFPLLLAALNPWLIRSRRNEARRAAFSRA